MHAGPHYQVIACFLLIQERGKIYQVETAITCIDVGQVATGKAKTGANEFT